MSTKSYKKKKRKRNKADKLFAKACLLKWGKECTIEGCDNPVCDVHHFKPKGSYGHLRYDLDNGVPLCQSHHYRLHRADPTISNDIAKAKGKDWAEKIEEKAKDRPGGSYKTMGWYDDQIERLEKYIKNTKEE